ncbi:superinfection immunity protein [Paraburkholderia kururiensis]|uniref:superinfection immunity protein n=1 Tax=Paraburkholderia kururiensis TaxID=984307 RepID=UPI002D7EE005|nr:superinfection immunity protein [Paraburkholderia kururiensis]
MIWHYVYFWFWFVFLAVLYFMPAVIAIMRAHPNRFAIGLLNILTGWTCIGWIVTLVWAFTDQSRVVPVED